MSEDLRALLTGGAFGGKSEDAVKDYARQVVIKVRLMQNLRLPEPGEVRLRSWPAAIARWRPQRRFAPCTTRARRARSERIAMLPPRIRYDYGGQSQARSSKRR